MSSFKCTLTVIQQYATRVTTMYTQSGLGSPPCLASQRRTTTPRLAHEADIGMVEAGRWMIVASLVSKPLHPHIPVSSESLIGSPIYAQIIYQVASSKRTPMGP